MTREELHNGYSKLSTQELLEIVDRKFEYTELAVTIALEELATRKVSEQDIAGYKTIQIANAKTFVRRNIVDDLSIGQKNLFFFLWIPILNFAFKQNFREDGYELKLKQASYYSFLGFLFFMLAGFSSAVFEFSDLSAVAIWISSFLVAYSLDEFFNRRRQIAKLKRLFGDGEQRPIS